MTASKHLSSEEQLAARNKARWPLSIEERFWLKVNKAGPIPEYRPDLGPCWIWTERTDEGYGRFWVSHRQLRPAHRWAYERYVGTVPEGFELDHLCRVRRCVRLSHLEPVTHTENDARSPLQKRPQERCAAGHEMAVTRIATHSGGRRPGRRRMSTACGECVRAYQRTWAKQKRARQRAEVA